MAIIKCKMCGGDLTLVEGQSVAECEYCGSRQTVPTADNEKKLNLFASANRLRATCEFDRAAGIYDAIKAEFPGEAEAYWGLVLCKYGIEYVDDPATGKKVPTCHRLSYDSVMDDANLELAMDYADAVARKVYREEAKHLEKIRAGILEVSSNEKPYDIFICYKETDENGSRTLDSVLAQDLYSALTEKGYRVFFSRITLQSKLGEAYEPYIFAALNSAKVMLAVGTDPDYYSAVWVKNEWSRYLKICAEDKSKHLIPCYKGLDAYDLPREFRPLQGVDLGKMGAVQDILFNMEKYIPLKKQTTTVIQEKVVVGGTGGSNKIASLLDRGNMALEDGDWAKADSFFEDVLNNDSKNAQAYIGKTLAQEHCRTMDALVRKRKDVYQNVSSEKLYIWEKSAHISQMVEQYSMPGYVEQTSIRNLYRFDLSYTSEVSGRQKQYHEEELWWQNHKQLSRAEKFAVGAVVEHLQNEKKHLFAQLADRVKKAQEADARSVAKLEAAYDVHIAEADAMAEQLYNDGLARREQNYERWLEQAKSATDPGILLELAAAFDDLDDYKDSKNLAEHCRKRAADEQTKIDAEQERQWIIAELKKKAQQKRKRAIGILSATFIILVIASVLVVTKVVIPNSKYNTAQEMLATKQYLQAIDAFTELGGYKDADVNLKHTKYLYAVQLEEEGEYEAAYQYWEKLGDYEDVKVRLQSYAAYPLKIKSSRITQSYVYDTQGNVMQEKWIYSDGDEEITNYVYDLQGRCIKENTKLTVKETGGGTSSTTKYEYDEMGRLVKAYETTSYGYRATREYSYDSKGNCIRRITIKDGEIISTVEYQHDSDGNCISEKSDSTNIEYTYDRGLCTQSKITSNTGTKTSEYYYNEDDHLIKEVLYNANEIVRTIEYVYDLTGKITEEIETTANETNSTKYLEYFVVYQPMKVDTTS